MASGNWELYSYHLFPHSLAYWIHRNKVVLEAISVNASKSQVPPFTCLLFEGMQQTHGKWVPIKIEWSKSNWNQLRSAAFLVEIKLGPIFWIFFFLNNFIIPVMCSTKPRLFVWWVKHYFYKRKVIGEVVDLRLWVHVQSLSFLNKKLCHFHLVVSIAYISRVYLL